jgi:hypothetical protein
LNDGERELAIGRYRPIYLWGGPGTIRMNRLKFPNVGVDESAHMEAHSESGRAAVLSRLYCNWVHLMYDWGFPPEVEREDWDAFEDAAAVYHAAGTAVFAYIQASNCVRQGSLREQDWYARDAAGRLIPYFVYRDRFMACPDDPEWRRRVRELIRGAVERGADGIFFDNIYQGDQPLPVAGAWLGSAGCHCSRCRTRYMAETGRPIPAEVEPQRYEVQQYLRWRAGQVTDFVAAMAAYARGLKPDAPVSANVYDPVVRDAYVAHGIDLESLASVQDIAMIENYGLPRWEKAPRERLQSNAVTMRSARCLIRGRAHLSMLSYDSTIGFDPVYPSRRYLQGIAEAAACSASATTKGSEYNDGGQMTLVTAPQFTHVQHEIGRYHRWLEANAHLFAQTRRNAARVGLLHPGRALWFDWFRLAPAYLGAAQTLTMAGIPWRVVRDGQPVSDLDVLCTFGADGTAVSTSPEGASVVQVLQLPGWAPRGPSIVSRSPSLRRVLWGVLRQVLRLYTQSAAARKALDMTGAAHAFARSGAYLPPASVARRALLAAISAVSGPRVMGDDPVLIEVWEDGAGVQIHLVNYGAEPQNVRIELGERMAGSALSPDHSDRNEVAGKSVSLQLDVYEVLVLEKPPPERPAALALDAVSDCGRVRSSTD